MAAEKPDFIIHSAGQPSHDRAAAIPYEDSTSTRSAHQSTRRGPDCRHAPFCFTSTNKVYGDRPNSLPLVESKSRYDYADGRQGIDETMPIDNCLHSLFGASKVAADIMCQELANTSPCLSASFAAAVSPVHSTRRWKCMAISPTSSPARYPARSTQSLAIRESRYVTRFTAMTLPSFSSSFKAPRCGEVYNIGGGRQNSLSILETIAALKEMGFNLRHTFQDENRVGDHICYITDLSKVRSHFPKWRPRYNLAHILSEIVSRHDLALQG